MMVSDQNIYCLNGAAVGDLIAAAPSVKYAIENYHQNSEYRVAIYDEFKDFYPFVPQDKFIPLTVDYDGSYAVRKLNMDGGGGNITRLTPSRLKLTDYASIGLLGRLLSERDQQYVPLEPIDVSHYNIDFGKCAIFLTTYRDVSRAWKGKDIIETAQYVYSKGLTPVFVGKTGAISIWKTLAVTDFTNVNPELRIPYRNFGTQTVSVVPNLACKFCQSDWNLDFHNFTKCPRGHAIPECTTSMTAETFLTGFDKIKF